MPVGAKRLLPRCGNVIFHKGWPCVYGMIASNILLEAFEKWLSARNASCSDAATSFLEPAFRIIKAPDCAVIQNAFQIRLPLLS